MDEASPRSISLKHLGVHRLVADGRWLSRYLVMAAAEVALVVVGVSFLSSSSGLAISMFLVAGAVGCYLAISPLGHGARTAIARLEIELGIDNVWWDSNPPRNKRAWAMLAAQSAFVLRGELVQYFDFIALEPEVLTFWSHTRGGLTEFARIPRAALEVVGNQWETPNVILKVTAGEGEALLALAPSRARFRGSVRTRELAYQRISSWLAEQMPQRVRPANE